MDYGMSFFLIALEQIDDERREGIKNQAIATYGAKSEKIDEFLKIFDKEKQKKAEVNHANNIAMLHKKL